MKKKIPQKRNWDVLPKDERQRIMKLADSLFIPPQFVQMMYENRQID